MQRNNLIVILTDQQGASAMSCAGHPDIHTPNLDGLAATGIRFSNAYCVQPLCGPSRAAMLTGRTPTQLNARDNGAALTQSDQTATLGRVLSAAGYECGYAGKWHVPELEVPSWSGFEKVHPESEAGIVEAVATFLKRDRDAPFLLVVSLTEPHGICQWARGQNPPSGPLPEPAPEDLPALPRNYPSPAYEAELPLMARSRTPHANPTGSFKEEDWRNYLYAYHRLVERADGLVGRVLALIDEHCDPETIYTIFSSDHGEQAAAHQWNQKWVLYEESIKVPLIVAGPGVESGGIDDSLVSTSLDLLPTLCELAGVPGGGREGQSLVPLMTAVEKPGRTDPQSDPWRTRLFFETFWDVPGIPHLSGRAVREGAWKYTCYAWGRNREQLVNLDTDPGELANLVPYHGQRDRLDAFRVLIAEESRRVGDHKFARMVPTPDNPPR